MQATDNTPEKFRDLCLLTAILVVAACARFYCLDQNALTAGELSNLLPCDAHGWLAMAAQYSGNSGMPPGYPTLICQFTDWTSNAEFFVRALSAVAGIASVYLVYLLGRFFLSPTSGLLAAAALATNLQLILLDRTATLYPVLSLFMLVHSYCFCRLLIARDNAASRNIAVNLTGDRWGFQWHWQPGFSCDARFLLGFWISGALAFYTSTISLVLLITELVASFFLVEAGKRRMVFRSVWVPLLVAMLPWMPAFYERRHWALHGHLFEIAEISTVVSNLRNLLPVNVASLRNQSLTMLVAMLTISTIFVWGKYSQRQKQFLMLVGVQILVGMMAIWLIKASDPQSYFYFLFIWVLIVAETVAIYLRKISSAVIHRGLVIIVALIVTSAQIAIISKNKVYQKNTYNGFEISARIIGDDKAFMNANKNVLISSRLFVYYLKKYGIYGESDLIDDQIIVDAAKRALGNTEFYYLEYSNMDPDFSDNYPAFEKLSKNYKIRCLNKGLGFRITKFSSEAFPAESKVEECIAHLSKGITL
jgi:4-amino-4-deoxy-L-arabinose transferase-like glycosyltransferase